MSYKFSKRSLAKLETCHPDLQRLFKEVIKHYDITIISGRRDKAEQNRLFEAGKSQLKYPQSKHNQLPSFAVDATLYPIIWDNQDRHYIFIGIVLGIAAQLGIKIRSGGDWDQDLDPTDQSFKDLVHFELIK